MAYIYAYEHEAPKQWTKYDGTNAAEVVDALDGNLGNSSYLEVPNTDDIIVMLYSQRIYYVPLDAYVHLDSNLGVTVLPSGAFDDTHTVVE